jgi:hypothetical protein
MNDKSIFYFELFVSYPIKPIEFFTQTTYNMHEFLAHMICNALGIIINEDISIVA